MCKSKKYTWFIKIIFHINTHLFYRCERGQAGKDRDKNRSPDKQKDGKDRSKKRSGSGRRDGEKRERGRGRG